MQTLDQICAELGIERNRPVDFTVAQYRMTGELPEGVGNFCNLFTRNVGLNYQCSVRTEDLLTALSENGEIVCTDGRGLDYTINIETFIIA